MRLFFYGFMYAFVYLPFLLQIDSYVILKKSCSEYVIAFNKYFGRQYEEVCLIEVRLWRCFSRKERQAVLVSLVFVLAEINYQRLRLGFAYCLKITNAINDIAP